MLHVLLKMNLLVFLRKHLCIFNEFDPCPQKDLFKSIAGNYMFKVNNRNTRARCEICSKLTIKTPERR